ncbi:hypothetical protein PQR57_37910 [Paraburkholderia dipogonis]|jgi:hypothetical protein|uniref:Secreted protein n=1 Tax=Paraburkholderia dipogonis TaxID=1211383 RepID=A0ABW9B2T9_9BURK
MLGNANLTDRWMKTIALLSVLTGETDTRVSEPAPVTALYGGETCPTGSCETLVVNTAALLSPPLTNLPSLTSLRLILPDIGALIRVNDKSSFARANAPSALVTSACAL